MLCINDGAVLANSAYKLRKLNNFQNYFMEFFVTFQELEIFNEFNEVPGGGSHQVFLDIRPS